MAKNELFTQPIKKLTMAEQMADTIKEMVLDGRLEAGETLPTEPELCEQFGVSRAVVRDATRILMALGLVDVKHGAGVFVTDSQSSAFGEALLIALRRSGATVWDVEEFEQILLPEVIALAAVAATEDEIAEIRESLREYKQVVLEYQSKCFAGHEPTSGESETFLKSAMNIRTAILKSSHNRVFEQLSEPLINLKSLRTWADDPEETPESLAEMETLYFKILIDAIASRDPDFARQQAKRLMILPPEAVEVMKTTPVGEQPEIPMSASGLADFITGGE